MTSEPNDLNFNSNGLSNASGCPSMGDALDNFQEKAFCLEYTTYLFFPLRLQAHSSEMTLIGRLNRLAVLVIVLEGTSKISSHQMT